MNSMTSTGGLPIENVESIPLGDLAPADPRRFQADTWQPVFSRLRREAPVHHTADSPWGPYWSVTRYHDIMSVDKDFETYSSESGGITLADPDPDMNIANFIRSDPPRHGPWRRTVNPVVAPGNLAQLESLIRERAARILDNLPVGEPFDWVQAVSVELTSQMLATLFNFPQEDRHRLIHWSDVVTASPEVGNHTVTTEERHAAQLECLDVFTELLAERRKRPPGGSLDFVTMLAHGEVTRDMSPMQILGTVRLLIIGGNDTTRNSISGGVLALNQNPGEYDKLRRDHGLIPSTVSEIVRWQTPIAYMRRTATRDSELGGEAIKAGDKVVMWYISGNRDDTVIPRADEFLIDRENPRQHLSFGFGIHRCMGNRLAEMQLRIVWEEILARYRFVEVVGPAQRTPSNFIHGITHLPVVVHRH